MKSNSNVSPLSGKSVLVTGATGEIGQAIVASCLSLGAAVFANARDEDKLAPLLETWSGKVIPLIYDVTDERVVKEQFRQIQKMQMQSDIGPLHGLVNNAGVMFEAPITVSLMDKLKEQLNINFLAPYQHMQLACRLMARQRKGSIVNILSQVGELGSSGMSAYASSKAALKGATVSLAKELAPVGIRVNGVAPGFIETAMTKHYDQEKRDNVTQRIVMKRTGKPGDVAKAVAFLLSEQSSYTTGHILPVDGAFTP
ncbi:SDR family NAD(P)-dependent oxidoreductase [Alteromonas sp. ASW11-130]|uniref:SDR family NAD(P)-dependent oxidoreductase n=1 Tax=Alteromonas sp. ASW11-130 TaxID=3015775 RepID=UPI0022420A7C|nr:SDR family NAD(P)-dependent oxidoreductase [Alteromonas sp. ASW11-130]MCW8090337.1 SDR family oxidoreductase [Alteromonas sp. ASW11-130]